ncbi:MAG: S41 family peptidase [Patescibacteria group bacterium]
MNFKIPKKISIWIVIILLVVFFAGGVLVGGNKYLQKGQAVIRGTEADTASTGGTVENTKAKIPDYLKKDVDFNLFWDVWSLVKEKYYKKDIPETQLFYGALSGIVASLGDPYSVFFTPKDTKEFQDEIKGNFEGIGAEIGLKDNRLTIVAPLPDTPAAQAGLRANDFIVAIDGKDTTGMTLDRAVGLIRGKSGTEVTLNIFRPGFSQPKDFKIKRAVITVKSLTWEFTNDNIAVIKIRQFNDNTEPLLNDAIIDISKKKEIKGIIVDLRNNPGGYLDSAIDVAGEWVGDKLIVSEKMRNGDSIEHKGAGPIRLAGYKTVVLVNKGSASGSEILAGALKDWKLATIVGTKTFGKGSVQDLTNLKDGSSIKLTIAKWFTPKGTSIEDEGIKPDIEIDLTEEDYNQNKDPQMDKALEIINGKQTN